ncbi:MAG: extracellular solute-binding protein [Candidatus Krumholzibacteriia bacterium]
MERSSGSRGRRLSRFSRHRRVRCGLALALLAAAALALATGTGCDRADRASSVVIWEQMDPGEQALLDAHIAAFRAEHPEFDGFAITRSHYRIEDLRTQFQTAALAYGGPNLVYGPADNVGPFAIMGLILPMDEILPPGELERFAPEALPVLDDRVYGLPDQVGNHLTLVANRALVDSIPTDTDAWLAQLRAVTRDLDGDGRTDRYGLVFNMIEPFWLVPWLGGCGGWVMDDRGEPTLAGEAMTCALSFMRELTVAGVVPRECDYPLADTLFKEGRAAYIINGPWSWEGYRAGGIDIELAPLPRVSATGLWPSPMTSAKCYSVNRYLDPATRECTVALLRYLTSTQVQIDLALALGTLPADLAARADPRVADDALQQASRRQIEKGRLMPVVPEMRAIWDAMRPYYQGVLSGKLEPAEAARRMQERAEREIERMRE